MNPSSVHRRHLIRAVALSMLITQAGCYSYAATPAASLDPATRVRVQLREPQDVKLRNLTANGVEQIEGEVVRVDENQIVVSAFMLRGDAFEQPASGETAFISRSNVLELQTESISPQRSALFGGLIALAGAVVIATLSGDGGGRSTGNPPSGGGGVGQ